jgi:hypothetical protein
MTSGVPESIGAACAGVDVEVDVASDSEDTRIPLLEVKKVNGRR